MMKLLVYNIAYGTGGPKSFIHSLGTFHRYLKTPKSHLNKIVDFIDSQNIDIVGLVEVDRGSYRNNYLNQVETVANHLRHYHFSSVKYSRKSIARNLPIFKSQCNAILTKSESSSKNLHFLPCGFKRVMIEMIFSDFTFLLVHLSIKKKIRKRQFQHISEIFNKNNGPFIIAGDFNTFSGNDEIEDLTKKHDLYNPNKLHRPTYPSWKASKELDFILCTKEIKVDNFEVLNVKLSDHLPVKIDFSIK